MSDNIVEFPSGKKGDGGDDEGSMSANDALALCKDRFEDVVIIGIKEGDAQLISTVSLRDAIFELSRANHILHSCIDRL